MKKLILIASTVLVLSACGKKDETVATTAAGTVPAPQTCTQPGYVWNGSSCVVGQPGAAYPGQPNYQYNGQTGYMPYYPSYQNMCGSYPQYPGQYPTYCGSYSNFSNYRWYSYNGYYFYVRY